MKIINKSALPKFILWVRATLTFTYPFHKSSSAITLAIKF